MKKNCKDNKTVKIENKYGDFDFCLLVFFILFFLYGFPSHVIQ